MKKWIIFFVLFFSVSILQAKPNVKQMKAIEGFSVPESVNYDTARNRLYVSNINGKGTEKNSKGYISIIDTDGKMIEKKWVKGLNAPKGADISGDTLYVSDINRIVAINIDSAKIMETYSIPKAKFLNDVATDKNGNAYISDSDNSAIYCLKNGEIKKWFGSDLVNHPNGLYTEDNYLYFSDSKDGWLKKVKIGTKNIEKVVEIGSGVDGLIKAHGTNFLVSDWKGKTQFVKDTGKKVTLLDTSEENINSADIEYIENSHLLFIPTFLDNRVTIYKLDGLTD